MKIKSAVFEISNSNYCKCPDTHIPEYAFIGRSSRLGQVQYQPLISA